MEAFHFKGYLKPKILPYRKLLQSFLFSYQVAIMQLKSLFDLLKIKIHIGMNGSLNFICEALMWICV
jgi:hypothetical protein